MIDRPSAFLCVLTASLTVLFYFFPLPKHAIKLPESKGSKGGSEIPPDQRIMDLDKQIHFFGKVLGKDPGEATGHPEFGPLEGVPQSEQIPKENEEKGEEGKEKGEEEKNKEDEEEDKESEQSSLTNKLIPVVTKKNKRSKGIKVNTENEESNKEKEKLNKEIKEVENEKEQVRQEKKEEKKKEKKDDKKRKEFEKK